MNILPTGQCGTGASQSRPFPARPGKVESAAQYESGAPGRPGAGSRAQIQQGARGGGALPEFSVVPRFHEFLVMHGDDCLAVLHCPCVAEFAVRLLNERAEA